MKKKILLAVIAALLAFAACEMAVRLAGHRPGYFRKLDGFCPVRSLHLYKNYTTDEAGIYKFSPWVTDSLAKYQDLPFSLFEHSLLSDNLDDVDRVKKLPVAFFRLRTHSKSLYFSIMEWLDDEDWHTEFVSTYNRIDPSAPADDWEHAVADYVRNPFNREGFHSIAFKKHSGRQPRILLIGDSFTYGLSARPFFNSYADRLLSRGYLIYNAGIPGTDPAQYAAIAQKYVPLLQPDLVVLCFFAGNDLMPFPREPLQDEPLEHMTNAGFFSSNPEGKYLSAPATYEFYRSLIAIPPHSRFDRACAKTALTGFIWNILYQHGYCRHPAIERYDSIQRAWADSSFSVTKRYLDRVQQTCALLNVPLLNVAIPDLKWEQNRGRKSILVDTAVVLPLFDDNVACPANLTTDDFPDNGDSHFNNSGSLKFADFLDTLIQSYIGR